jgi:phage gp36-like protein
MSWTTPTALDLQASLSADELATVGSKSLAVDQDAAAQIVSRTVDLVRGYVRRSGVALGPAGSIPPELLAPAMDIAAVDFFLRLNLEVKQGRADRRRDAVQLLRDMADGKGVEVVGPEDDTVAQSVASPSILSKTRTTGRDYEHGI